LGQHPDTGFCEAIGPKVPSFYDAARHLVALLPDAIPVILRQGDDDSELLQ
jgi:hypothetical protein